jgi:2-haloacid dehalogenase
MAATGHDTVLFDLGAVLVDWNPRYLYRGHFGEDATAMERFLRDVCPTDWVRAMDAGKPVQQAVAERSRLFPAYAGLIALWGSHWETMLRDAIHETVEILSELRARRTRLFALTNWSAENFPIAFRRFDFFRWFEDIVVSGEVGLVKPDPRIYQLAISRCRLNPPKTVFIDDNAENVGAGNEAGLHSIQFTDAARLRADLQALGLL